ncbi:MAG: hypothetical protein BGN85_06400 [Alphaproteobacteria bacterium 64-11]|nr:hypothetical protein [Alphaproteobacteria bacterium]OJU07939.1 MAG: hypothetical protein BGN85_06400 [Alphaproteobacteria bacterium 64-11]
MTHAMTTRDHELIRAWAEARGGHPARTSQPGGGPVLRLDFRAADENLAEASWEPFFRVFDRQKLAFLYQERTDDGRISRYHQFIRS